MKFVTISDTHRQHKKLDSILPEADMIIHSGDMDITSINKAIEFLDWFSSLDYKYKIFIAGNHDKFLDESHSIGTSRKAKEILFEKYPDVVYLEDSSVEIEGVKIYGSPYTPRFGTNWAFQLTFDANDQMLYQNYHNKIYPTSMSKWSQIPEDTDILITHGPPYGILDKVEAFYSPNINESVGDKILIEKIEEVNPKYHIFGHIHEQSGILHLGDTTYINASVLDEEYNHRNNKLPIWSI